MTTVQMSVAVGLFHVAVASQPIPADAMTVDGHEVNIGAEVSTTMTLKLQDVELPFVSVAVTVTNVVPKGNALPDK
jgi:hypothetical protein